MQSDNAWQPIESAPTDGTRILARDVDDVLFVCWCEKFDSQNAPIWESDLTVQFGEQQKENPVKWTPVPPFATDF